MRLGKLLNLFAQLRVSTHTTLLELADLSVNFFKRVFEWLDHVADGRLPPLEFASGCLLKRFEVLFREIEERLVVAAQSVGRTRFECIGEFGFGVAEQRDFVLTRFAFLFETRLKPRAYGLTGSTATFEFVFKLRPGDKPEGNSADDNTDDEHRHGEDNFHGRS